MVYRMMSNYDDVVQMMTWNDRELLLAYLNDGVVFFTKYNLRERIRTNRPIQVVFPNVTLQ